MYKQMKPNTSLFYKSSKPYTRWWWFSGEIKENAIKFQLDWLKRNNFGGVEIAWVYPLKESKSGPKWLGKEWSEKVSFTKKYADRIGLGCDFTFGSLWPFGGSIVRKEDASRIFNGLSPQRLNHSWEQSHKKPGYILNHLDKSALEHYSGIMGIALSESLKGSPSSLFCDSWEVSTEKLWTNGFDRAFENKFGYSVNPYILKLDKYPAIRYDYRKLISEYILNEFYKPFTEICHRLRAFSRVQCHGSPTDLLASYSSADIPESEAILFDPDFSVIPASAAALSGKKTVSCETFTCLYGWVPRPGPAPFYKREQVADMKLLADALFANGINHIIWHGMPYNPKDGNNEFYASVHVGPDSYFADELPAFNRYIEKVSGILKHGRTYSDVAVYLPIEDTLMTNTLPKKHRKPSAEYHWEMHYVRMPAGLKGYHPLWISPYFLKGAYYSKGILYCGNAVFTSLYIDVKWLDKEALAEILRLARSGLPVCIRQRLKEPGMMKTAVYDRMFSELMSLENVSKDFSGIVVNPPLVKGKDLPDFWCRLAGNSYYIFFAHPKSGNLSYPLSYGQSFTRDTIERIVRIRTDNKYREIKLTFKPYQSILLKILPNGTIRFIDIEFKPVTPLKIKT
ncbi:MAG: glycosyl hydrolase [Planctomycetota bacterium]